MADTLKALADVTYQPDSQAKVIIYDQRMEKVGEVTIVAPVSGGIGVAKMARFIRDRINSGELAPNG